MAEEAAPQTTETQAAPAASATPAERMQAAIEKGKQVASIPAEDPNVEKSDGVPAEDAGAGETVGESAEGAEAAAAGPEGGEPKTEPKTDRAKKWAAINKKEAELAKRERANKRDRDAAIAERAELQKIQQRYSELDRLYKESPKEFLEQLSGRPGGLRDLFVAATAEEKRTPEEQDRLTLKKELEELKTWRASREKADEEARKRWKEEQTAKEWASYHQENVTNCRAGVEKLISGGGFPALAANYPTARSRAEFSERVYEAIYAHYKKTDIERPISEVLNDVEAELAKEAGSATDTTAPSARANGAESTAKPEAKPKRAPPSLTNERASARASAGRELKGEERKKHFASMLRTRPD